MNNYWANKDKLKEKALYHTTLIAVQTKDQIAYSANKSIIYSGSFDKVILEKKYGTNIIIESIDSVEAIKKYSNGADTSVLNFASYKNPGGKFLQGSSAQEESLCHASNLYNVLSLFDYYYEWNKKNLNKALYLDRAIYSPYIIFGDGTNYKCCNVITCAAPNYTTAGKYCRVSYQDNLDCLKERINFILDIAAINNQKTLILGAFGCGVFGQNPTDVAKIFKYYLDTKFNGVFETVIFAIPSNLNCKNYNEFFKVFA